MKNNRENAIDAADVLNDLISDFIAGTNTFRDYRNRYKAGTFSLYQMSAVQKMCFSHIALAFCKLLEFWEKYREIVPEEHCQNLKSINSKLSKTGVLKFRNKVAGHIWDRKNQRPLYHSEIMTMLEKMIGENVDDFLNWINDPNNNVYPNTIISIVETIRDSISNEHNIDPAEIVDR